MRGSQHWGIRALEFVDAIESARSSPEVLDLFSQAVAQASFGAYVMCGWSELYLKENLAKNDPAGAAMVELHVVCDANSHRYAYMLEHYFRIRHEIYVQERGWTELARPDGREINQFDKPDTTYLMTIEGNRVIGSHRSP